jgi:hypothetical protein
MDILKECILKECQKFSDRPDWKEQGKEEEHGKDGLMRLKRLQR